MLQDSLDAVRQMLKNTFPEIDRIYVNTMPDEFKRPSFYIGFISSFDESLNKVIVGSTISWQIVYFALENQAGFADAFNQFTVAEKLESTLTEGMVLTSPSGVVYHVLDCEGGPRDNEVYITVRLEAERKRPEPVFDKIQDVGHEYKGE